MPPACVPGFPMTPDESDETSVDPHETLFVPQRRRFVSEYVAGEGGARELHVHFGLKEITFDEPDLFPWAEKLIQQDSFMAGGGPSWAAPPLGWPRGKGPPAAVVGEGIGERAGASAARSTPPRGAPPPHFLPRGETRQTPA